MSDRRTSPLSISDDEDGFDHFSNEDNERLITGRSPCRSPDPYLSRSPYPPYPSCIENYRYKPSIRPEYFEGILVDINQMDISANQTTKSTTQAKRALQRIMDHIDPLNPRFRQLGLRGVLKELREETIKAVFDYERARLRAQKVSSELLKFHRGLKNLQMFTIRTEQEREDRNRRLGLADPQWLNLDKFYD